MTNTIRTYLHKISSHNSLKGYIFIILLLFIAQNVSSQQPSVFKQQMSASWLMPGDTAYIPQEIQDPRCIGINKEAAHATLMPYSNLQQALVANRHASGWSKSLNGDWKFNWVGWPQQRPVNFYKMDYDVSHWANIHVPSNWQVLGYGTPYYSNYNYIFQKDFPNVMSTPPVSFTAYKERNPVGSYRRDFEIPENWDGRQIFIDFDGVDAGFFLWVNGHKVGYSVNSRNVAEFDITQYVHAGTNMVAAEVYRFTTGSYLEDQDMWRLSGIFRNVTLWSAPKEHIRDFFIKTNLDKEYKNATVEFSCQIKNYLASTAPQRKLEVSLYDADKLVNDTKTTVNIPSLKPGQQIELKLNIAVKNPKKWTAETPYLYTTIIQILDDSQNNKVLETESTKTGFRNIEIKGRLFLVNGVAVKLKGVNRHENYPDDGHAITEAQMIEDIMLIKQANCNMVRTCHYSDDPRWYELCDEYGIYLCAEANLECHGAWDEFNEDPRIKDAIIDRNIANVENFKNHPSILFWSLGNECGSGGSNFRAALAKVREIDPTRPTHYQGFGIGDNNPADIDSEMYTDLDNLEKHAKDNTLTKPFFLCEYAHAMFNSMGSVADYNDLFDKYPSLLGGCIWEWQDQGIYNHFDPKHPITAYGGGFGEVPNDQYFIHKGVVFSDRSLKPHYPELKHAYQWISIIPADLNKGSIKIKNRYQFISLADFDCTYIITEDGKEISKGNIKLPVIMAGDSALIKLPVTIKRVPGKEYIARVAFSTKKDVIWAKKGFEIASQQLFYPIIAINKQSQIASASSDTANSLKLLQSGNKIIINGNGFMIQFDKTTGIMNSIQVDKQEIIKDGLGPQLHLWRAPHRNDDMWADRQWSSAGLKDLKWELNKIDAQKQNGQILIQSDLKARGNNGFELSFSVNYQIQKEGTIHVQCHFNSNKADLPIARMGVRMYLNEGFDRFSYYGRGPFENYSDRKRGSDVGIYSSSVAKQLTPYEKPMECGNHEDIRWGTLKNANGQGIQINQKSSLLQLSALPYSDEQLEPVEYKIDLPASHWTVLNIDYKTLGVGSNGCGPIPQPPYRVYAAQADFDFDIQLLK